MRLVTFQDKYVYNYLYELNNTVYENKNHNIYDDNMENILNLTTNKLKSSINGIPKDRTFLPIWTWVLKEKDVLDDNTINEMYSRYIPKCQDIVMFDMIVPNQYLILMNFDLWYDYIFDVTFNNKIHSEQEFEKLFKKEKGATLQAVIPLIHKSWIKHYEVYNDARFKDYSQTDSEIHELISSGKIKLNDDGMIEQFIE